MKTRIELANNFAAGKTTGRATSMFIDSNRIYSYGYHFPIAARLEARYKGKPVALFTQRGYSNTTARHKSFVLGALYRAGYFIIDCDLGELRSEIGASIKARIRYQVKKLHRARLDHTRDNWKRQLEESREQLKIWRRIEKKNVSI